MHHADAMSLLSGRNDESSCLRKHASTAATKQALVLMHGDQNVKGLSIAPAEPRGFLISECFQQGIEGCITIPIEETACRQRISLLNCLTSEQRPPIDLPNNNPGSASFPCARLVIFK